MISNKTGFGASLLGVAALLGALAGACGGGATPPPAPPTAESAAPAASSAAPATSSEPASSAAPAASASAAPEGPPAAWKDDLSPKEKAAFMKANVAPRMGKVFQEKDPKHYAEFGCKTCHGPDHKDPKEFLPHLTMKGGQITAFKDKPGTAKFMSEKVVPEMASVLGKPPFDMKTKQGFGCMGCHTVDQK